MIFKCLTCGVFSFEIICKKCQKLYLKPEFSRRGGVVSFYEYETVERLIKYKYSKFGHRVFKTLAFNSFRLFAKEIKESFFVIPVDDRVKKGYSHTAVLANAMKTEYLKPVFNMLHATNDVRYAGKSLDFRLRNPRNFKYKGLKNIDVILVDDICTTGLTLNEAEECISKSGANVVLKVVLANLKK